MRIRIREVVLTSRLEDPARAEVWVSVIIEPSVAGAEVRGRLMGPQCLYASTIEVAYAFQSLPRPSEGSSAPTARVLIPEPSLWEPACPFLYHGPVELWEAGQLRDHVTVRHGLCHVRVAPRGLRLNGRPFTLHGARRDHVTEEDAAALRAAGINTLLADAGADGEALCEAADRLGFFVVLRRSPRPAQPGTVVLSRHPSFLGWLDAQDDPAPRPSDRATEPTGIGVELTDLILKDAR